MDSASPGHYAASGLLLVALVLVGASSSSPALAASPEPSGPGARGWDLVSHLPDNLITCEKLYSWENVSYRTPPDRWKLAWWQASDSGGVARSPFRDYFCTGVTPGEGSSPMCNLLGGTLLMAVRFAFRWPFWVQANDTNNTSGDASQQYYRSAPTTSKNIPWMLADNVIEANTSQRQLTASKRLHGEAQVDLFLCSDEECTVQADLRRVLRVTSSPLGGLHERVQSNLSLSLMFSRFANTSLAISAAFAGNPNTTTSCVYTSSRDLVTYRYARSVWAMDKGTTVNMNTVFWVDETSVPLQIGASEATGPSFMPTGVLQRLWVPQDDYGGGGAARGDLILEGAEFGNDHMGLETLRYGLYRARDLHTGSDLGCITLILPAPDNGWMDRHGWNESDPLCHGAQNGISVYVFVSYLNQAWWLDERVKPLGAVRLNSHNQTVYASSEIDANDESTYGVAYESRFPLGNASMAPHLRLNASAFQAYGKRMGLLMSLSAGVGVNQQAKLEFWPHTSQRLNWTAYEVISIGTATLLACKAPDRAKVEGDDAEANSFSISLLRLKLNMTVQPKYGWQALKSDPMKEERVYVWCWGDGWPRLENDTLLLHACDMERCGDHSGNCSVRCNKSVGNCSFLDSLHIGFAHGPPSSHGGGVKVPRPPTLPASGLMGQVERYDLIEVDDYFQKPMQGKGVLYSEYLLDRGGPGQVMRSSARALQQQMAVEMTNTDATRTLAGSLMDTTLLVAGIFALASGYGDLCILITRLLSRLVLLLVCGCPYRGIKVAACVLACVLAKFLTCLIIAATLVVGPALTLVAENEARDGNPSGDETSVRWVEVKLGPGPYHMVAAVAITIEAVYNHTAFLLVKLNLGLASLAAFCLCCCVLKKQILCVWRACDLPVLPHSPPPSFPSSCMGCVDVADVNLAVDVESAAGSSQHGQQQQQPEQKSSSTKRLGPVGAVKVLGGRRRPV